MKLLGESNQLAENDKALCLHGYSAVHLITPLDLDKRSGTLKGPNEQISYILNLFTF